MPGEVRNGELRSKLSYILEFPGAKTGPEIYNPSVVQIPMKYHLKMWVNWVPGAMEDEVKQTTKHFVSAWNKS